MKVDQGTWVVVALLLGSSLVQASDLRVWTDTTGKKIEAEHVRTLDDKVILEKSDGTEVRVSLDTLSERDRRYAILQRPPRLDISVSPKIDRSNKGSSADRGPGAQVQKELVVVDVKIKKSSSAPYEAPLRAELYVLGQQEQKEGYVVLSQKASRFLFKPDTGYTHEFSSADIKLKQLERGKQIGIEYAGYLVAVRDKIGDIVELKCSKLDFEKNAEAILGSKKGTQFDRDFNDVELKSQGLKKNGIDKKNKLFPIRR